MKNAKVAQIVPLKFLHMTSDNMYHMCLAHLALKSEEYALFYRRMSEEGKYVLMDNGAAEKEKLSYEDLLKAYSLVKPTEIILPDVLLDKDQTLSMTSGFLRKNYEELKSYKKMIVPQGKDESEWLDCLLSMIYESFYYDDIDSIGIPKWLGSKDKVARISICSRLSNISKEIHLLGCNEGPAVLNFCKTANPKVRGCDSAFAYLCAKYGNSVITEKTTRPPVEIDFLKDTKGESRLQSLMDDFEIAAGVYNNKEDETWLLKKH